MKKIKIEFTFNDDFDKKDLFRLLGDSLENNPDFMEIWEFLSEVE